MSKLKVRIRSLLEDNNIEELTALTLSDTKIITALISLSYDKNSIVSWRAIEAIGTISKEIAKNDTSFVKDLAGRLLWMIRDESGGIGWSSPEILGEIVRNNPRLCADIAPIIASFHEEKMLTSAVLRAMGRIGKINQETVEYSVPIISSYLNSSDHTTRGHAAFALGELGNSDCLYSLEELTGDKNIIEIYDGCNLIKKPVGEIAAEAILKIQKRHSSEAGNQ